MDLISGWLVTGSVYLLIGMMFEKFTRKVLENSKQKTDKLMISTCLLAWPLVFLFILVHVVYNVFKNPPDDPHTPA